MIRDILVGSSIRCRHSQSSRLQACNRRGVGEGRPTCIGSAAVALFRAQIADQGMCQRSHVMKQQIVKVEAEWKEVEGRERKKCSLRVRMF